MNFYSNFISRSKRQNPAVLREYLQLQQSSKWQLNSLPVVHPVPRDHLPGIFTEAWTQIKKPLQKKCRGTKARIGPAMAVELQLEPNDQKVVRYCRVPHNFKCSWPAKKSCLQYCCHHHSLDSSYKETHLENFVRLSKTF